MMAATVLLAGALCTTVLAQDAAITPSVHPRGTFVAENHLVVFEAEDGLPDGGMLREHVQGFTRANASLSPAARPATSPCVCRTPGGGARGHLCPRAVHCRVTDTA